ncbi:MAG: Type 1 glutamine amidotransferase-like domain-containing protein [Clostridia bacterium]|jgi:peptidase E|nr:Type 1 glutamine amidotransferase-like domain-containing protein [Clostridia bacterium]
MAIYYLVSGIDYNDMGKEIFDRIGKDLEDIKKVVFIPGKPHEMEKSFFEKELSAEKFKYYGIDFSEYVFLDDKTMTSSEMKAHIDTADMLVLLGGHPEKQMKFIRGNNITKEVILFDKVVLAMSAGAMNLSRICVNIPLTEYYNDYNPYNGLWCFEFSIMPHFNVVSNENGGIKLHHYDKFNMDNFKRAAGNELVYCLSDNDFVRVSDRGTELCGDNIYVYENGEIYKEGDSHE